MALVSLGVCALSVAVLLLRRLPTQLKKLQTQQSLAVAQRDHTFDARLMRDLLQLSAVAYCNETNVVAWNCSFCSLPSQNVSSLSVSVSVSFCLSLPLSLCLCVSVFVAL